MDFTIKTAGVFYPESQRRERLAKLGFTFKKSNFRLFKIMGSPTIQIETLEELIKFSDEWESIIINGSVIVIYDDYIE